MTEERASYGLQRNEERAVTYEVGGQQIRLTPEIVRKYLVTGNAEYVTEQELVYFLHICRARGLNPFNRDCYLIKYSAREPAAIVVSVDRLRAQARKSADCAGWQSGIIVRTESGEIRYSHGLLLPGETLLGGWFEAKPKGWGDAYRLEVNLAPYIRRTREGEVTRFWSPDNQPMMISKVAEAQGLRRLWPEQLQGLYLEEEVGHGDQHQTIDVPPAETSAPAALDRSLFNEIIDDPKIEEFVGATAAKNRSSRDEVIRAANQHPERFRAAFARWAGAQQPPPKPEPPPAPEAPRRRGRSPRQDRLMDNIAPAPEAIAPAEDPQPAPAPATEPADQKPPAEENPAFSQTARHQVIAEIQSYSPDLVATAKRRFGIHERLWPPTLEGCHRLLDMVIELALGGGGKEGK